MRAALKVAENVRDACAKAAAEACEYAGIQGLCTEGRWELARRAIEEVDLQKIVSDSMRADGKLHGVSDEFDLDAYLSRIHY